MNTEWFQNMLDETQKAHCKASVATYRNEEMLTVLSRCTEVVWVDGVPNLKMMDRADSHPTVVPANIDIDIIHTKGRTSGCQLVYWLLNDVWFCATHEDAVAILDCCFIDKRKE